MKSTFKRLCCLVLSVIAASVLSFASFAAESSNANKETYDLGKMDLTKPFSFSEQYMTPDGEQVIITNSFVPAPQTRGSETKAATVGTWTSSMTYGVFSMLYKFDLSHPNGWEISNPRDLITNGSFMEIKDRELSIGRATSTPSLPATISGTAFVSIFDNQWIHLLDMTYVMSVTVTHDGVLTTTW